MAVRLEALDHVTVLVRDLPRSLAFYRDLLGFEDASWRPPFAFDGAWLALGGHASVHLVCRDAGGDHVGAVDHFALRGADADATRRELEGKGVDFAEQVTPDGRFRQFFLHDPDGVKIELVFPQG